ncbi:MAG TPA: hypothetical protein VGA04_21300 [Streptosporangiaceae bacterium]
MPVVITIWVTPSSPTAASATSASCAGVFAAMVAPSRSDSSMVQNRHLWSSAYRIQVCTTVVASEGAAEHAGTSSPSPVTALSSANSPA